MQPTLHGFSDPMVTMKRHKTGARYRGVPEKPGRASPSRDTDPERNLKIFHEMRDGKYADGEWCLRAKIDMASPNIHFRDPVIYRIRHVAHYHLGNKWCIYPMYDFAHQSRTRLRV